MLALVAGILVVGPVGGRAVGTTESNPSSSAVTSAAGAGLVLPPTPVPRRDPPRVAFFGDSIAVEAEPHVASRMRQLGTEYRFEGFGGTAICDYLDLMRAAAENFQPDVVVLLFTGNALTPCIVERSGGPRAILGEEDEFDLVGYALSYDDDTAAAIEIFGPHVDVILVGVLPTRAGRAPAAQIVDDLYRGYAERMPNVHYVWPEGLLDASGAHADVLPCTFVEPCVLGEPVPVRAADGAHLCPDDGVCYGGLRMAIAITEAIARTGP
jgi:hypothetical protein